MFRFLNNLLTIYIIFGLYLICVSVFTKQAYRKTLNIDVTNDMYLIDRYERRLAKCLTECNLNNQCEFVIYVSSLICKMFKIDALTNLTSIVTNSIMYKKLKVNMNGLTNYWPLNQNFKDQAGNAHFYNCINASLIQDRFNIPYSAIYFNTGACQVKPDVYFKGNLTILAWIKVSQFINGNTLLDFNNGISHDQVFFYLSGDTSSSPVYENYNFQGDLSDTTKSNYQLNINQWYHVAVLYGPSSVKIYVNGKSSDFVNSVYVYGMVSQPTNVIRNNCFIGHTAWESYGIPNASAHFDDIKIYNRSLSLLEILNDFY